MLLSSLTLVLAAQTVLADPGSDPAVSGATEARWSAAGTPGSVGDVDVGALVDLPPEIPGAPVTMEVVGSTGPGAYEIVLNNTGTGFKEKFLLQLPPNPSRTSPSPLLVAFHKFGNSALDIALNTTFEEECYARNWFLVAPLGAAQQSFSSIPSQLNTELVLDLVIGRLGAFIDRTRIYGVGFSMGGANAMSFAARRVDPTRPMFAAIVNHTGSGSLAYTYESEPSTQATLEFWYGGPPEDFPFEYARSSVFDVFEVVTAPSTLGPLPGGGGPGGGGGGLPPTTDPVLAVRPYRDLVRNLTHVPMYFVRAKLDPTKVVVAQFDALADHIQRIGGQVEVELVPNVFFHLWSTLDEEKACDWMAQHRLTLPEQAVTIADRDARYFHFDVEQEASGAFTPFAWQVFPRTNTLHVLRTANLARLTVRLEPAGLDGAAKLTLLVGTLDGKPDHLRLAGVAARPSRVLRDGHPTDAWTWDPQRHALELLESDGLRHRWEIEPPANAREPRASAVARR